jgi:hypothetical protein
MREQPLQVPPSSRPSSRNALARWLEHPFKSIYAGLAAQLATLALLMAGILGLTQLT